MPFGDLRQFQILVYDHSNPGAVNLRVRFGLRIQRIRVFDFDGILLKLTHDVPNTIL